MSVMRQLLPSYQTTGSGPSGPATAAKREGPQLEGGQPKRGRGRRAQKAPVKQESVDVQSLTHMMARMMLQHEDVLNSLLLEMELMIFMQSGEGSVLQALTMISEEWHKQMPAQRASSAQGAKDRSPLRVVMAQCFFTELAARSSKVQASGQEADKLRKELIHQRLLTEDGQAWMQVQWSSERERLEPTSAPVLRLAKAHEAIMAIQALVQILGLLLRFHALRPLHKIQAKDGSTVVPWKMVIGHREEKAKLLYGHMQTVCHSAVTQLVLTRIRPANMRRSPLAQKLSQALMD